MAKRPAFTPDEARLFLEGQRAAGNIRSIPHSARERQRLARGLSQGKTVAQSRGHGRGESRPAERQRSVGRSFTYQSTSDTARHGVGKGLEGTRAWRIGPTPRAEEPGRQRGRIPQPDDLVRFFESKSSGPTIMVGIYGYLGFYMERGDGFTGWVYPHVARDRNWLLGRLRALPRDHHYEANDPAYLQLAHDIFAPTDAGNTIWIWEYVFQWSVRDL